MLIRAPPHWSWRTCASLFLHQRCAGWTRAPCTMVGQMGLDTLGTFETFVSNVRDTEDETCVRMRACASEHACCRDTRDTDLMKLWCAGRTSLSRFGVCVYTALPGGLLLSTVPAYDKRRGKSDRGLRVRRRWTSSSRDWIAS